MSTYLAGPSTETRTHTVSGIFVWICGVILPAAAVLFEAMTAACAGFIDPMPTLWHLAILLAVPVCNVLSWWGLKSDNIAAGRRCALMSGFSAAVALFYTLLFLPIMPMALVGLIVVLPVLAFAPALSFWTALRLMRDWTGFVGGRVVALGFACGVAVIVVLAWPAIGVRAGAGMVQSERPWVRDFGYYVLRLDGVRQELLEACHSQSTGDAVQPVAFLAGRGPLTHPEAQALYYRVTGRAFEQEPAATLAWRHRTRMIFDANRGRNRVGGVTEGVRLASSRVDGSLDARSAAGYFEWTMVFRNSTNQQQEARMEMALPKRGVVSRATLWIHGSEREAAFGERGQVRQAYERVVTARRDPLLVTSSGPDRVLVQCFPIEPAGEMKIRIGITAPVEPDEGTVTLPALLSQNFVAGEPSWAWIESKSPISDAVPREDGVYVLRTRLAPNERKALRLGGMAFRTTWAPESPDRVVEQRFVERTVTPPKRIVVVVDGSESMRGMQNEIRAALATIPRTVDARVVVVGEWRGGVDAVPALEEALPAHVLWVAGEQPVSFTGTERIRQALERQRGQGRLFVLATGGTNVVLRDLDGLPGVEMVPRIGTPAEDLRRFVARWRAPYGEHVAERRAVPAGEVAKDAERGSSHIVRLWAAEESASLAGRHRADAVALAVAHQIVTPWSGAVVLETAAQYQQNGLQPASPSTVPTMPEPETYGLIAVGLGVLLWLQWRRRNRLPHQSTANKLANRWIA